MTNFNTTRYGFSGGKLSEGFQGQPDLGTYRRSIKESLNFHAGMDGVARFRKGFENGNCAAPFERSDTFGTGAVKTIQGFGIGSPQTWFFLDFCETLGGDINTIYIREEGLSYNSTTSGTFTSAITSSTVEGEIALTTSLPQELHRVGSSLVTYDAATPTNRTPLLISEVGPGLNEVTVVQANGIPYSASTPLVLGDTIGVNGWVLTTALNSNFDWVAVDKTIYIVDGNTRVKIEVDEDGATLTEGYTITNDPFPVGENPTTVTSYQSRVIYGGFSDPASAVFFSRAPDNAGLTRYDDFTTGSSELDAILIYISPDNLAPITEVKWLQGGKTSVYAGTNDGVAEITSVGVSITATDIDVNVLSFRDPSDVKAVIYGNYINWASNDGDKLYESQVNRSYMSDVSYDISILTDIKSPIVQIERFISKEEGAFLLLENGDLLIGIRSSDRTFSFFPMTVPLGYSVAPGGTVQHLHSYASSEGLVLGMNVYFSEDEEYRVYTINIDEFFRYDYFSTLPEMFPYLDSCNESITTYFNGIKEKTLDGNLQLSNVVSLIESEYLEINESDDDNYDLKIRSNIGTSFSNRTIAIPELGIVIKYVSTIIGYGFYANYVVDTANLNRYDFSEGPILLGHERLKNTYFLGDTFVFSTNSKIPSSAVVIADGREVDVTLTDSGFGYYFITLDEPAYFVQIGLKYTGRLTMLPITTSGTGQQGYNRPKSLAKIMVRLLNSGDGSVYVNRNDEAKFEFLDDWYFDLKQYYNGVYEIRPYNGWQEQTELTFFQTEPQPLNISMLDIFMETSVG